MCKDSIPVDTLIAKAIEMLTKSYAPYSHYCVGAALLCKDGSIYTGCNVENIAYTPSNCAERTAFFKAVSEGKNEFAAIAIVGGPKGIATDYCAPCGVCRQVMVEFCDNDFKIISAKSVTDYKTYTLAQLLPESFCPKGQVGLSN